MDNLNKRFKEIQTDIDKFGEDVKLARKQSDDQQESINAIHEQLGNAMRQSLSQTFDLQSKVMTQEQLRLQAQMDQKQAELEQLQDKLLQLQQQRDELESNAVGQRSFLIIICSLCVGCGLLVGALVKKMLQ